MARAYPSPWLEDVDGPVGHVAERDLPYCARGFTHRQFDRVTHGDVGVVDGQPPEEAPTVRECDDGDVGGGSAANAGGL